MNFKFKLNVINEDDIIEGSSLINIKDLSNLDILSEEIINYKNNNETLSIILLNFLNTKEILNNKVKVLDFLLTLDRNNVYFRIINPFPSKILLSEHSFLINKYRIADDIYKSLQFYTVENGKVIFYDGIIGSKKFSNYNSREEIYNDYMRIKKLNN